MTRQESPTVARHVTRTFVQAIAAPPSSVFPLLCPTREKEWLDGWECEIVHSTSGLAEVGCVFRTKNPGSPDSIWVVTAHDPVGYRIEFVIVVPESRVGRLEISLEDPGDGTTRPHISYTFTSLGEAGNRFINAYTEPRFRESMTWWEASMNHFLRTGTMLRKPPSP